jgi:hypothetical protein
MSSNRYPRYKVFGAEGESAYVLITYKDGHGETWVGFATEEEAEAWVAQHKEKPPQNEAGKPSTGWLLH